MDDWDPGMHTSFTQAAAAKTAAFDGLVGQILDSLPSIIKAIRSGMSALGAQGVKAIGSMAEGLKTPEEQLRLETNIRILIRELDSRNDLDSVLAASALEGMIKRSRRLRFELLVQRFKTEAPPSSILDSEDPIVRQAAIGPLIERYGEGLTPALIGFWGRCTAEEKLEILKNCIDAQSGKSLVPRGLIFQALADPDRNVRAFVRELIPAIVAVMKDTELVAMEEELWAIARGWPKRQIKEQTRIEAINAACDATFCIGSQRLGITELFQTIATELFEARKAGSDAETIKMLEESVRFLMDGIPSPTLHRLKGIVLDEMPKDPPTRFRISKTTREAQANDPANFRRVFMLPPRQKK